MAIDIILLVLVALACVKGIRRGLVAAIFSFLALIIGLAAAMKLSVIVAGWLQNSTTINKQWLPVLSFILVMVAVALLVRWVAVFVQKSMESLMMGWLNRIGGVVFYLLIYLAIYSVVLFYAAQMALLKPETLHASKTYVFIEPLGPKVINATGQILPVFKNLFADLEAFFGSLANKN